MSFTTRCPACGTTFRVVADQLKISEGWVRCGHCADVFDATLYLRPWSPPGEAADDSAASPASASVREEPAYDDPDEPETAIMEDAEMAGEWAAMEGSGRVAFEPEEALPQDPPAPLPPEPSPASAGVHDRADEVDDDSEVSDFHSDLQRFAEGVGRLPSADTIGNDGAAGADAVGVQSPLAQEVAPIAADSVAPLGESVLDDAHAEPGFVRQARRRAFWQSPGMRAVLVLIALSLTALLAGQWVWHERDRLAAARPEWRPALQQACDVLGCRLAPVRRIDAVVIDSTALVRKLGNFYAFDLVLRNTASIPLAVPALELSLTDTRDGVIARRVFLPEEWPDAPALLPAQGSVTVNFSLSLALGESTPMAGYRALVFYP
ncbi:DUF3426 domain-containing protein [Hydrogenophaga sp.]|uniref:DUF3426 domain-containing protein n=1 Tax=Hydrogenophaga sp. TaxID=1904254 RepID=UPI00262CEFBE|nr:DUF3426 domain-containing protein [Hydrogenophaga sp.]MCW5653053.1 DUF3426 domain-containing protein [Hydrogenophaga sp.]